MSNQKIFGLPDSKARMQLPKIVQNCGSDEVGYFDSYSHFEIHEEMLKDKIRTESYQKAILMNSDQIKDKIVLDIGAGTGILSLFAAEAGAKHVYSIECAEIAEFAKNIVKTNGFSKKITVIKGKLEKINLPVKKVDVIISEWMGYFLLFESMLDSVLFARDKWLKKDGLILPDKTSLFITAIEDHDYKQEKIHFWDNVYGYDMSCMKNESLKEPLVDFVDKRAVVTNSFNLITLDLYKCNKSDLTFEKFFKLKAESSNYLNAFMCYFDIHFSKLQKKIWFSTGPKYPQTHWKQTIFYTDKDIMMTKGGIIKGKITVKRNPKNFREIDIRLQSKYSDSSDFNQSNETSQRRLYHLR